MRVRTNKVHTYNIFIISLNSPVDILAMALCLSVCMSIRRSLILLKLGFQNVVAIYILLLHIDRVYFTSKPLPLPTLKIV